MIPDVSKKISVFIFRANQSKNRRCAYGLTYEYSFGVYEAYRDLLPQGLGSQGVKLTSYFNAVLTLRVRGATPPLPHTPSWRTQTYLWVHT